MLRQLFRGYAKRDDATFRTAAEAIIQDERIKNHRLLADDLERILLNGNGSATERRIASNLHDLPKDRERGFSLLDIFEYTHEWDRLVVDIVSQSLPYLDSFVPVPPPLETLFGVG